ncbi:hepatic lectin [Elysia marginata]|uniref:Hepatic lectin n=1 Tax=Elysia marginata TaxID=1093978 RepID=A0AAV4H3N1_9GAST|nr:hepatic lectin [Elysia marginata]
MEVRLKLKLIVIFYFRYFNLPKASGAADICSLEKYRALGFIKIREIDKCLLFSSNVLSWHGASGHCATLGTRLYTAFHAGELLQEHLIPYKFRHEDHWIGLNDIKQEGDFMWHLLPAPSTHGHIRRSEQATGAAEFMPWRQGQPDDHHGGQDCVMKGRDGLWRDETCTELLHYICEAVPCEPLVIASRLDISGGSLHLTLKVAAIALFDWTAL